MRSDAARVEVDLEGYRSGSSGRSSECRRYFSARTFGGLPAPPGISSGAEVSRNS